MRLDVKAILAAGAKGTIRFGGTGGTFDMGTAFIRGLGQQKRGRDFQAEAGDLWKNNIVLSTLKWQSRQFPQARPVVRRLGDDGQMAVVADHPALELLRRPNAYQIPANLWAGVLLSLAVKGTAYLWRVRANSGRLLSLRYLPHFAVVPVPSKDADNPIAAYRVQTQTGQFTLLPEEVIRFADGVDPENPLEGLSPLGAIFKEVFTDEEAAACTATLLDNLGIPGAILMPRERAEITPEQADAFKRRYREAVTGRGRGDVMVMDGPWELQTPGFSPRQMLMDALRDVPEERITAALGIPAAIVGLGAGLAQTTNRATADALQRWAWQHNILPTCQLVDAQLTLQLMPDYLALGAQEGDEFGRDTSGVEALRENENELFTRLTTAVGGPWMAPNEARSRANLPALPDGDAIRAATLPTGGPAPAKALPFASR